ncbi:hypothetical protein BJX64DRAFT_48131 [Aspergillus heterothallicus]
MASAEPPAPSSFVPRADAAILTFRPRAGEPPTPPPDARPQTIGPIHDPSNFDKPISPLSHEIEAAFYPNTSHGACSTPSTGAPSTICDKPPGFNERYLRAFLAHNERLRLSMLWYYTRALEHDAEFLAGLQEKAHLAQESTGWEFAVIGILDLHVYIRLATVGLQLGILPRGETLCAHTVTQPPGSVFLLPALQEDWRFRTCPYLEQGGLYAYAGVPLRLQHESGTCVGLGSLCVASRKGEDPLTKDQQQALVRLADWVVSDMVQFARGRRQRERHRMSELIHKAQLEMDCAVSEEPVMRILKMIYPNSVIKLQPATVKYVELEARRPILVSELESGLWEDVEYLDELIAHSNHRALPTTKTVRVIAAPCETALGSSLVVVGSKDFHIVFDDVDAWFVQTCAGMISQMWRKRLLVDAINAKEKFLRGFSHQLRTPVHGILGSAELLAEELKAKASAEHALAQKASSMTLAEYTKYLSIIKMGGRDLISIINNMITLNRWVDIAMTDRHYASHGIDKLEAELSTGIVILTVGDTRYNPTVFFTNDCPRGFASFWMDIDVLRDSLLPIIYNAVQHTPDSVISVHTYIDTRSKQLIVDIKDTGVGIHQDDQRRIFEAYEKVDAYSARAGLGLTLASRFATLLHGSVALMESSIGRGSHFRATFRDVEFARSEGGPAEQQSWASEYTHLPPRFYNLTPQSKGQSPSGHFTHLLKRSGFTTSDSVENCFVILEASPDSDSEAYHARLSQIPSDVICIVLLLGITARPPIAKTAQGNIIYASGPYTSATLRAILRQADAALLEIRSQTAEKQNAIPAQPLPVPIQSRPPPLTEIASSRDESHNLPTINGSHGCESAINGTAESTPRTDLANGTTAGNEPNQPRHPLPRSSPHPTTLIVDDNMVNLRVMEMYCKKRGLPYLTAKDGLEAIEVFSRRQKSSFAFPSSTPSLSPSSSANGNGNDNEAQTKEPPIELIFMDLQMPLCDGIQATRRIRALEEQNNWHKALILVMTGQDTVADKEAAREAGNDEYFVKPVIIQQLDRVVKGSFSRFGG